MKTLILVLVASTLTGCVIRPVRPYDYYDGYYYYYPSPYYHYYPYGHDGRGGRRR